MRRQDVPNGARFRYLSIHTGEPMPTLFQADGRIDVVIEAGRSEVEIGGRWDSLIAIACGAVVRLETSP
jgi:hypothetical protein